MSDAIIELQRQILDLQSQVRRLEAGEFATRQWIFLATPLTSSSWDGDSFSNASWTLMDLSAVFGAPAKIKAVLFRVVVRDSGSSGADCYLVFATTGTPGNNNIGIYCGGLGNDRYTSGMMVVPCDGNGDVYYSIGASGASTFDIDLQVWGYCL